MRDVPVRLRLVALVALVLALGAQPRVVSAHTDLDFTTPADGETVAEPVAEVIVAFTAQVEPVGNGFEALDPAGNTLQPPAVTDDGQVYRLQFDPPLAGGAVGVRYEIRSEDGHVISGSFSFVVDAPVPTTSPATSAPETTGATTTAPATTAPAPEPTEPAAPGSTTSIAPTTTAVPTTAGTSTTTSTVDAASDGSSTGIVLAIAAAAAIGIGGFFLIRSRTSGAP